VKKKLKFTERQFALTSLTLSFLVLISLWSFRTHKAEISALLAVTRLSFEVAPPLGTPAEPPALSFGGKTIAKSISNIGSIRSTDLPDAQRPFGAPILLSTNASMLLPDISLKPTQVVSLDVAERGSGIVTVTNPDELELLIRGHGYLSLVEGDNSARVPIDLEIPASIRASPRANEKALPMVIYMSTPSKASPCAGDYRIHAETPIAVEVPIKQVSFVREIGPGGLSTRSSLISGLVKSENDGSQFTVSSLDSLQFKIRKGVIRRIFFDDCAIRIQLDATVEEFWSGSGPTKRNRMPTFLSELMFQKNTGIVLLALIPLWGFLWSIRSLFVAAKD
jgi:hypothetical protein